jgi:DNA relaxase NicK
MATKEEYAKRLHACDPFEGGMSYVDKQIERAKEQKMEKAKRTVEAELEGLHGTIRSQHGTNLALIKKLNMCADTMEKFLGNASYTDEEYENLLDELASVYYILRPALKGDPDD